MWMGFAPHSVIDPRRRRPPAPCFSSTGQTAGRLPVRQKPPLSPDKDGIAPVPALVGGPEDEDILFLVLQLTGVGGCVTPGLVEPVGVVLSLVDDPPLPYLDPFCCRAPFHTSWLPCTGDSCCASLSPAGTLIGICDLRRSSPPAGRPCGGIDRYGRGCCGGDRLSPALFAPPSKPPPSPPSHRAGRSSRETRLSARALSSPSGRGRRR